MNHGSEGGRKGMTHGTHASVSGEGEVQEEGIPIHVRGSNNLKNVENGMSQTYKEL